MAKTQYQLMFYSFDLKIDCVSSVINIAVTVTANTSCYSIRVNPSESVTVSPGINLNVMH